MSDIENLPLEIPAFRGITFPPKDLPNHFMPGTVDHVIDGDSAWMWLDLQFDGITAHRNCRFLGIQAPDKQPAKGVTTNVVKAWLTPGTKFVAYVPDIDKYGRPLVAIFLSGLDITLNEYLIREGLAVPYDGQTPKPDTVER